MQSTAVPQAHFDVIDTLVGWNEYWNESMGGVLRVVCGR